MQKQEKSKNSLLQRWSKGLLADRREPAIVTLALCLLLALLAAHGIVHARAQDQLFRQRGADLVKHIRQTGLVELIGRQPQTRFYLIGQDDQITGYAALVLEPQVQPDHSITVTGRQLQHWPQANRTLHTKFDLANDLAYYLYSVTLRSTLHGKNVIQQHKHSVSNSVLRSAQRYRSQRALLPSQVVDQDTLIPTPLRYIAPCLALDVNNNHDTIFTVPVPSLNQIDQVELVDVLVQHGASIPNAIKEQHPNALPLRLTWIGQNRRQNLLCNHQHQLLYRRDLPEPADFWQEASRDDIINKFPQAASALEDWLGLQQEPSNGELL